MSKKELFFYNMYGVECEPKDAYLISEVKLPEPDPNLPRDLVKEDNTWEVSDYLLIDQVVDLVFGVPPRLLENCRMSYYSGRPRMENEEPSWIRGFDEAACYKTTLGYMGGNIWVNALVVRRFPDVSVHHILNELREGPR
jgi:hypothetical protein